MGPTGEGHTQCVVDQDGLGVEGAAARGAVQLVVGEILEWHSKLSPRSRISIWG